MHCLIRWWGWGWQVCWHCWCWWHEDWQAPLEWVVGWWFGAWCAAQEFSVADGDSAIAIQFDAILVSLRPPRQTYPILSGGNLFDFGQIRGRLDGVV